MLAVSDRAAEIVDRLRADGSRITASRVAVVEAIVDGPGHHVTALDVLRSVRRDRADFPESTVYRTIDRLVEVGVLTRMEVDGGPAVYHLATSVHHHVVCDRCGRVFGIGAEVLDQVAKRLRVDEGFVLRADAVTLPGHCVDCEARHPRDVGGHGH